MQWPHLVFNITCKILTPALFFICNLCNCCSFLYAQKIISFIFPVMLCMKSFLLHFAKEKGDQHSFISFSLSLYEHASLDSMSSLYHWYHLCTLCYKKYAKNGLWKMTQPWGFEMHYFPELDTVTEKSCFLYLEQVIKMPYVWQLYSRCKLWKQEDFKKYLYSHDHLWHIQVKYWLPLVLISDYTGVKAICLWDI